MLFISSQKLFSFSKYFDFCRKNGLIREGVNFKMYDITTWVNKRLQYTYCPISHEVKTTRQ